MTVKNSASSILAFTILLSSAALAKDKPVAIGECPDRVQAVIRQYSTQATFESVALDEKKKTGGPAVYEAKFKLPTGKRIEVHISPEGKVIQFEEKSSKS